MRLIPRFYLGKVEELLLYSGSRRKPAMFLKQALAFSITIGFLLGFLSGQLAIVWPAVSIAVFALFHGLLLLAVDSRTRFVENILPDALQLIAANIRSGFIPSRALILSARKEFGPLSEGIILAGKEMLTGKSFHESLQYVTKKIKSDMLETTMKLISRGVVSGGQMISLFEETAVDIRRKAAIKKEIKANIVVYGMFITFASAVGAPALYALSGFLVGTISRIGGSANIPEDFTSKVPLLKFGIDVSSDFLLLFSIAAIIVTTVFAGMIIGIINSGREKGGIRYIPILMTIAFAVYIAAGMIINSMFAGIVPR